MGNREDIFHLKELKIELTHRCPLACIHCSSDASQSCEREMDTSTCLKLIRDANKMGVEEIVFSGGEPLLWHWLETVVEIAASGGLFVTLYSSGNIDQIGPKLKSLKEIGVRRIVFSVFGSSQSTHEWITRKRGSFDTTIQAASIASQIGYVTEFHFVPLSRNYKELPMVCDLARNLNIGRISVLRFVPQGRGNLLRKYALNRTENQNLKRMIIGLRQKGCDVRTGSPYNFLMVNEQPECLAAQDRLIVGPDGHIYPCDAFKQIRAEEIVGTEEYSILDRYTLEDCWGKSPYLRVVRDYLVSDFEEPCASCKKLQFCLSGCLAQKVIARGRVVKGPDPMCIRGLGG